MQKFSPEGAVFFKISEKGPSALIFALRIERADIFQTPSKRGFPVEKQKTISIFGWYGNNNSGDEALLRMILRDIQTNFPDVEPVVFSKSPDDTHRRHKVRAVKKDLWRNPLGTIRTIQHSDAFIFGGGTLLEDDSSRISGIASAWLLILIALLSRTPVLFFAQGIGPIHRRFNRLITRILLNRIQLITVRELDSLALLYALGVRRTKVFLTADPAINLRDLNNGAAMRKARFVRNERYHRQRICICPKNAYGVEKGFSELADLLIRELDARIFIFPMQRSGYYNDVISSELIIDGMSMKNQVEVISGDCEPEEVLEILGEMDLVIGMRLHSLIYASASYVPVIAFSYARKIRSFMKMIGREEWVYSLDDLRFPRLILKRIREKCFAGESLDARERRYIDDYKYRASLTIRYIKEYGRL